MRREVEESSSRGGADAERTTPITHHPRVPILSDEVIREQLRRAEAELCVDDPELCLGFPETVEDALARLNPSGYCFIGAVWSRIHHWSFGVWFNVDTGQRTFAKPWWHD